MFGAGIVVGVAVTIMIGRVPFSAAWWCWLAVAASAVASAVAISMSEVAIYWAFMVAQFTMIMVALHVGRAGDP